MKKYLSLLLCSAISLCAFANTALQQDQTAERIVGNNRTSAREVSERGQSAAELARAQVPTVRKSPKKSFAEMAISVFTLPTAPVAAAAAPLPFNSEDARKANCIVIGSDSWSTDEDLSGIYEFPLSGSYNFSLQCIQMDMWKISTYNEGVIYSTTYDYKAKTSTISQFDEPTREKIKTVDLSAIIDVDALSFDPVSGNIYAYYYKSGAYYFGTINPETGAVTDIKGYGSYNYAQEPLWRAMIATPDGRIYSTTVDGTFQQVNKQNGELTVVVYTPDLQSQYYSSGMYDPQTGMIYYFTCNKGGSALYTVNPADGAVTKVYDVPYNEQVVCVYTPDAARRST